MTHKTVLGFADGPAISDSLGRAYTTKDIMSDSFLDVLGDLFDTDRVLFPLDITSKGLMRERYQAFLSFRRTSSCLMVSAALMRAAEMGVSASDIYSHCKSMGVSRKGTAGQKSCHANVTPLPPD
jgi:hypothetical protein